MQKCNRVDFEKSRVLEGKFNKENRLITFFGLKSF